MALIRCSAAIYGQAAIVKLFLDSGAEVNGLDSEDSSALSFACVS